MVTNNIGADAVIANKMDILGLLNGTMEECGELIQTCSKYLRANNIVDDPTPISVSEARENLQEELIDVYSYIRLLLIKFDISSSKIEEEVLTKQNRYANRLLANSTSSGISKDKKIGDQATAESIKSIIASYCKSQGIEDKYTKK